MLYNVIILFWETLSNNDNNNNRFHRLNVDLLVANDVSADKCNRWAIKESQFFFVQYIYRKEKNANDDIKNFSSDPYKTIQLVGEE